MTGNLCRCANYNRYVEAVVAAGAASSRTTRGRCAMKQRANGAAPHRPAISIGVTR